MVVVMNHVTSRLTNFYGGGGEIEYNKCCNDISGCHVSKPISYTVHIVSFPVSTSSLEIGNEAVRPPSAVGRSP